MHTGEVTAPPPRSTWKVLLVLGLALVLGVTAVGACLAAYAGSAPERTLEVPHTDLQPGVPRFYPLPVFGADASGRTHGVWVVQDRMLGALAFHSRDPVSVCVVAWRAELRVGEHAGVFRDPCSERAYGVRGERLDPTAPRPLDRFELDDDGIAVRVFVERLHPLPSAPTRTPAPR